MLGIVLETMQENLKAYKETYQDLKEELSSKKEGIKKVQKAKKLVEKVGVDIIELKSIEDDLKYIGELEKEIKLCKSIIRRYETLLNDII